ncbi:NAD-dependent epimerase/dehydratase family protein [Methylorubrum rhodesianum]|jgi:UDP-glucuronate 4-epimerase|uniref:NAD-dependent epimerase/dehydratase family protein n=1 Tax=Methylorubrum rhodesianum TaxID=29427 RepID=A0ABU9ZE74_9HYPH|nr:MULTISPECIES: NAD-dependent epimerase/dehydratase family protein [Methylorubrum]MBB5765955.1 UDP-glucuronate 4-epimerase [Methylorubrum rhodesianum]MBI1692235.1 NAD-dependent epimerase/dehydratase family protein [Methylorubrum sp. DB1722]MBK3401248.1 NAD-dependent epimerase/dehydratase family protein [Methylorubrum rhodesianum]MBY0144219.1 NAD-dependent epimerase/dehydratase family protein [Methylorubrum populi]
MHALVTGSAGFIGHALSRRLLAAGHGVTGFDGLSPYYDVTLKRARHADLARYPGFDAVEARLETPGALLDVMARVKPDLVFHLAAQAGVRYSLVDPGAYVEANLVGFANLLEAVRAHPVRHLLMASTSSAYGGNASVPFRETDRAVSPLTLYAASKLANEAMAHSYAHLFRVPTTAFRFFTVYGPWGRPDMALFLFTRKILAGEPIEVFGEGAAERDFTFIDDLIDAIVALSERPPPLPGAGAPVSSADTLSAVAPYRLVNIGGGRPVRLDAMIGALEAALGRKAERVLKPLPPGDVIRTHASTDLLHALVGSLPETPLETGIPAFVKWYLDYYGDQ